MATDKNRVATASNDSKKKSTTGAASEFNQQWLPIANPLHFHSIVVGVFLEDGTSLPRHDPFASAR